MGAITIMIWPLLAPTNSVPAVAARQRGQVLFCLNGRKGCVGWGRRWLKNPVVRKLQKTAKLIPLNCEEVGGILCLEYSSTGNTKVCRR